MIRHAPNLIDLALIAYGAVCFAAGLVKGWHDHNHAPRP